MKLPALTKKFWIVIATIIVVGLLFAYYLLVYVSNRQAEVIAQNYRVLKRAADNSIDLRKNFEATINNYKNVSPNEPALVRLLAVQKIYCVKTAADQQYKDLDSIYFSSKTSGGCTVRMAVSDFLPSAIPKSSCFDDLFLIRTLHKDASTKFTDIGYQTFYNRIELKKMDSLFALDHGLESSPIVDARLFGTDYKIFTTRILIADNESWILCGAVKNSNFNKKIHEVDTYTISFAILILLFVLLAMPILKLIVMNAVERLRIVNVWFTGFSIIVGTAIIILILISANHFFSNKGVVENRLKKLAIAVNGNFDKELNEIYDQLRNIQDKVNMPGDSNLAAYDNFFKTDTYSIRTNIPPIKLVRSVVDPFKLNKILTYKFTNQVMWLDARGDQLFTLATQSVNSFNLSAREYFTKARDGNLWTVPGKDLTKKFSLQSIRSYRNGRNAAGFGIPLKKNDARVLAMSTRLHSIMDPLLPPGYGFCIMSDNGDVWFHSERQRNMQENFLDETERNKKLVAAVAGRMQLSFNAPYDHRTHQMYILPVRNLPLYLVTFYDMDYYKSPLVLSVGYAFILMLFMFALIGIQLLLQFVSVYRPTKLKVKRFYLSWLRPRKITEKQSTEPKEAAVLREATIEKYLRSVGALAMLNILLIILLFARHESAFTFGFMVLPLYILLFQYLLFERENILRKDPEAKVIRQSFIWLSIVLIVLVNYFIAGLIDDAILMVAIQIVFAGILLTGYFLKSLKRLIKSEFIEKHAQKLYFTMVFLWLAAVSVLPVFAFYRMAYHEESLTWTKYLQWEIAQSETKRNVNVQTELAAYKKDIDALKEKSNYLGIVGGFLKSDKLNKSYSLQGDTLRYYFEFISRPPLNKLLDKTFPVLQVSAGDSVWCWFDSEDRSKVAMKFAPEEGKPWFYTAAAEHFDLLGSNYFVLFFILLIGFFYLIFHVTRFAVRSIFGLGVVLDTRLLQDSLTEIKAGDLSKQPRIFLVGLPYAGKNSLLADFSSVINLRTNLDTINVPQNAGVIVIKHFEYGINSHDVNDKKLQLLLRLVNDDSKKIIIVSTMQPTAIFEFYEEALQRAPQGAESAIYKQAIRQWKNVMSGFILYFQPLSKENKMANADEFVQSELNHGQFLPALEHHIPFESTDTYACQENFVLKIEELADAYYQSLWNSFSNAEKFLLYDLAKDRYVNLKNVKTIRLLLQKGVIAADDSIQIMNKSFGNFILSVVSEDEEIQMEKELSQKGSWNIVQSVLIVLLIGLVAFIAIAQQDLFRDLNVLIGALGSAIALLTRFGGLFNFAKPKDG